MCERGRCWWQVLGVFSDEARWWAWKLDLVTVTVTLIFILPYSFFFLTLRHMDWPIQSALATAAAPLVPPPLFLSLSQL